MAATSEAVRTLARFGRLMAISASTDDVLRLLAQAVVDHLRLGGAAIEVLPSGLLAGIVSAPATPWLEGLSLEADIIGPELGARVLSAAADRFVASQTLPLVCEGRLYGALVLLFESREPLDDDRTAFATAVVDLAAVALDRKRSRTELEETFVALSQSRDVLARTEKLRALGQLAASVSHDVKNAFTPLILQVELCRRQLATDPSKLPARFDAFERVLHRGLETVDRLRRFGKHDDSAERVPSDVNALVHEVAELCGSRVFAAKAKLDVRAGDVPAVDLEPGELVAALTNLVVNSIDALPKSGGRVVVSTAADDHGVVLAVTDNGAGIPRELQPRLFEPFFTTKGDVGTGLGLAMVYAFVRRNGGSIDVSSEEGAGTTFTLHFPPSSQPARVAQHH